MTTKNLYTIMFDSELPGSPEQVIGAFKDGKTTYAKIFECLCVYVKSSFAVLQDINFIASCSDNPLTVDTGIRITVVLVSSVLSPSVL